MIHQVALISHGKKVDRESLNSNEREPEDEDEKIIFLLVRPVLPVL